MKVDVSEVKTYRECKRKHQFSSRNRFHLRPTIPNPNLEFGTQFHEVLAMMYLGTSIDKILEWINLEVTDSVHWKVMDTMARGYYEGPYQEDKERYVVIDSEKSFNYPVCTVDDNIFPVVSWTRDEEGVWWGVDEDDDLHEAICVCGSIDMICIDVQTGKFVGFEHKTAKNFRPEVYDKLDEQPRVYSWALRQILKDYHAKGKYLEVTEVGPIYMNQVKKLQTKFAYQRTPCEYTEEDLSNFMRAFVRTASEIAQAPNCCNPDPGFMKCQMCDFADLCMHYGYANIDKDDLLKEFDGEFEVREHDHLEEKAQRHAEDTVE